MTPPTQRQYFSFFWPLTLMGLAVLLSRQFQNAVLAGYPDAAKELAIFAFASSLFWPFNIALGFVPQMTNILSRCRRNRRVCLRFVLAASLLLSAPLLVLETRVRSPMHAQRLRGKRLQHVGAPAEPLADPLCL